MWLLQSVFFAILAVFTRMDSVIFIFALLIIFCIYDRSAIAWRVLSGFILVLIVALGVAYLLFGRFFFINTVIYNLQMLTEVKTSINVHVIASSLLRLLPLVLAVLYLAYRKIRDDQQKCPEIFIVEVAICYVLITHLMMLRAGASINYVHPASLLLVLSFAMLISGNLSILKNIGQSAYACIGLYLVTLFLLNYVMKIYAFSPAMEAINERNYYSLLREKAEIIRTTKRDTIFFPNAQYGVFFYDQPMILGHDNHIDRLFEVLSGKQFHTKLLLASTKKYDRLFETGNVQYIIAENNDVSRKQLEEYYKHFRFFSTTGRFSLYKYTPPNNPE